MIHQPTTQMNSNTTMELLKVENQLLKSQLKRESDSKELLNLQLRTVLEECKTLEMKLSLALTQQRSQPSFNQNIGGLALNAQLQNLASLASLSNQLSMDSKKRERDFFNNERELDTVGSFKRSKSFAQAKQQLNNQSCLSLASSISTTSSYYPPSPSQNHSFCNQQTQASSLLPEYLKSLQLQVNASLGVKHKLTKISCVLCQKKGLECKFEGRSKVCLNCKKSKKKCEHITVEVEV